MPVGHCQAAITKPYERKRRRGWRRLAVNWFCRQALRRSTSLRLMTSSSVKLYDDATWWSLIPTAPPQSNFIAVSGKAACWFRGVHSPEVDEKYLNVPVLKTKERMMFLSKSNPVRKATIVDGEGILHGQVACEWEFKAGILLAHQFPRMAQRIVNFNMTVQSAISRGLIRLKRPVAVIFAVTKSDNLKSWRNLSGEYRVASSGDGPQLCSTKVTTGDRHV